MTTKATFYRRKADKVMVAAKRINEVESYEAVRSFLSSYARRIYDCDGLYLTYHDDHVFIIQDVENKCSRIVMTGEYIVIEGGLISILSDAEFNAVHETINTGFPQQIYTES